ncbi:MAG: hypothetical protein HYY26_04585 [Acidobacteria bacterium]|nr:hypothetical protein [Acidobacteriota bacterium]
MTRARKALLSALATLLALGAALAWRLHTWGQPVQVVYRLASISPASADTGRSVTYIRTTPAPHGAKRYVALDSDTDGTIDLVLLEGSEPASFARPRPDDPDARWLILCIDGVPFAEMDALWREGYFREFFPPVPVIAPFPSASALALSGLFHAGKPAGYEDRYFDRAQNQLAGGAFTTTRGDAWPYSALLDYDLPGPFRGLAYVFPRKSYRADLGRLRQRFLSSNQRIYLAHLATGDSLYHVVPREEARHLLRELDPLLRELYFDSRGKLRITLFSDHGNSLAPSRLLPLEAHLAAHGWCLRDRLDAATDVVAPAYGLLGSVFLYCHPERRAELARLLAEMEGVDLAVYAEREAVVIESARGRARLRWDPDATAFAYEPLTGDPLALASILEELKQEGKIGDAGWVGAAELAAATREHLYPDVAHRLWQWATNQVEHPPDVVASLRSGYHYGSSTFGSIVTLLGTHGSLDLAQSLGFAMSTDTRLPAAVRTHELLPENLPELKKQLKPQMHTDEHR